MARRGKNGSGNGQAEGQSPQALNGDASAERLDILPDIVSRIESAKQRGDDARSDLGNIYQDAEERGFNRRALKDAVRLRNMEPDKRRDYLASLNAYCEKLGLFAQTDLFDEEPRPPRPDPPPLVGADLVAAAGARKLGWQDGLKGDRNAAHLYGQGTPYHADYELGWQDGQRGLVEKQMGSAKDATLAAEREEAIKDPFAAGKKAALHGSTETRNPFDHPSIESADWLRGHAEGARMAPRATDRRRRRRDNGEEQHVEA